MGWHLRNRHEMKLKRISLNETEIRFNEQTVVFFSYDTPVAAKVGVKYYRTEEKHSWFENRLNWNPESFLCKS